SSTLDVQSSSQFCAVCSVGFCFSPRALDGCSRFAQQVSGNQQVGPLTTLVRTVLGGKLGLDDLDTRVEVRPSVTGVAQSVVSHRLNQVHCGGPIAFALMVPRGYSFVCPANQRLV